MYEIPRNYWQVCNICWKTLTDIHKESDKRYFSQSFKSHIESHGITLDEYFYQYHQIEPPTCPCEVCNKKCGITIDGANIRFKKMACGRTPGTMAWSEQAKESRRGKNNPMYGKTAWNLGLTKNDHPSLQSVSNKMSGRDISDDTRAKQSASAKKRKVHGHTGCLHSEESKQKMREATLARISNGDFAHTKTVPHNRMATMLDLLGVDYIEEQVLAFWCIDFYIPEQNLYIEVDGDYFHSNPILYPHGPQTQTQKVNAANDKRKNTYCHNHNITLVRFWESDILNHPQDITCKLKKLLALDT